MKKSKVIIPAMAMILFSTAASISGTVAWFTANRVFNTEISNFTVRTIDGNLEATMIAGVGTTNKTGTENTKHPGEYNEITVAETNFLIDASFDHTAGANGKVFRPNRDNSSTYDSFDNEHWSYRTIGSNVYYVAYSWTIKFYYDFGAESNGIDIFFDKALSTLTPLKSPNVSTNDGTMDTAKGFRIAFLGGTGGRNVVWGGLADATSDTDDSEETVTFTHIKDTTAPATAPAPNNYAHASTVQEGTSEAQKDFIYSLTDGSSKAVDERSANENLYRADRIGYIGYDAAGNNTTITCVAWFEGTDPNVVNNSILKTVAADMHFYARARKV